MYVCVCIYIYIYIYKYINHLDAGRVQFVKVPQLIYIYICIYTYIYINIHTYIYTHIYIYTQISIYLSINIYIYIYKYICIQRNRISRHLDAGRVEFVEIAQLEQADVVEGNLRVEKNYVTQMPYAPFFIKKLKTWVQQTKKLKIDPRSVSGACRRPLLNVCRREPASQNQNYVVDCKLP